MPTDNDIIYEVMQEILAGYSDNHIRDLCRQLLKCEDLTPAEKRELLHFLFID